MKIIEKCNRRILSEGRNYGMGFGYLKKINSEEYHTVQPLSPCKDYLNDVVWSEHNDKPITACGLTYNKTSIFNDDEDYIGIKILQQKNYDGNQPFTDYPNMERDIELLNNNFLHIEVLINYVEKELNIEGSTDILPAEDNYYLLMVPKFWSVNTFRISLYSLIIRMGLTYDGSVEPKEFLDTYNNPLENNLWNAAKPKLQKMIELQKYPEDKILERPKEMVHGYGITSYKIEQLSR